MIQGPFAFCKFGKISSAHTLEHAADAPALTDSGTKGPHDPPPTMKANFA